MKHKSLFILGRQPELGRAELESVFGAENLEPVGSQAMACSLPAQEVPFGRLGGSVRMAVPLAVFETTQWRNITRHLGKLLPSRLGSLPADGKIKLGLSAFGLQVETKQLVGAGLELKKALRQAGRSARIVPNTELELSSAQVLHNQLVGELGIELLLIRHGNNTYVAQTTKIQDIEAYARRDQQRPKRDARVGMLPPKLAQIIVNLAAGTNPPAPSFTILDPFCGTGVVLQEALLMGFSAYGTDLEPRMADFTATNIDWLHAAHPELTGNFNLDAADATSAEWEHFDAVACETYLGRPFSAAPQTEILNQVMVDVNTILAKFLQNITRQAKPGTRLCLAVPAWQTQNGFKHLPLLDHLEEMGYNRVSFEHVGDQQLVYYRPGQIVARELLVITRK